MAFHHRKLLNDSLPNPPCPCNIDCDIRLNPGGICRPYCFAFCPSVCKSETPPCPPPPPPPSPPPPPPPDFATIDDLNKPRQLSHLLIASLAVLAVAFFLFTCYTIYRFYTVWRTSSRRRRQASQRRNPEEEDGDDFLDEDQFPVVDHPIWYIRTVGLQPSVINAITIVKYKRADGIVEGTDCAVCLNEFEEDETLRLLPKCNHAFHIPCIDTWLGSHTNCPMCRAGIVSNSGRSLPSQVPVAGDAGLSEDAESESITVGIEDHGATLSQSGLESNEEVEGGDCKIDLGGLDGLQPVRRSVSMDSVSASMISAAVANAFPQQFDRNLETKENGVDNGGKGVVAPAIERSMQTGSSSIKRSASCSAKVFLSRHSSRSRN